MKKIGIVLIATNAYFILGIRFIKKFIYHYKGNSNIQFYFFSDTDPVPYLPDGLDVKFYYETHTNWVDGTNSKFKNIISLIETDSDYLFYFDADTNISKNFNEDWFLGDLVGGEHYGNRSFLSAGKGFDRFPQSKAYVPENSELPYTYHYGAFFGGKKDIVINFCKTLRDWQIEDKKIPYEPGVNDESYLNAYFHFNPPYTVKCENFMFDISDKGGLGETRNPLLDIEIHKKTLLENKDRTFNISNNNIIWI